MLTLSDFREKRILIVNAEYGHNNLLQLNNSNICFVRDGTAINKMSCHNILAVFIVGDMSITTNLLKKLTLQGISVFFLNHNLKTTATAMAEAEGNYLLRQKQYITTKELVMATSIVENKIDNQETVLKHYEKLYHSNVFIHARNMLENVKDNQQLLGIEGSVGKEYFQTLFEKEGWNRRAPQTKEDIINLLLDIGYTYLFNYCDALLRLFGFDTYKGYYHQLFFQRKSLVCDVMEPMRPIIDYQLLKSFHLKQIKEKDFVFQNGRFAFKDGFKTSKVYSSIFLQAINDRREEIYAYILDFYHYSMDDAKYKFPYFKI